ncbi:MAG: DUF4214 domain-containing protein [Myxococcaceae bacterium]
MRSSRLGQFFRDVSVNLSRSPEVRTALNQAVEKEVLRGVQRFVDRFEAKAAPGKPTRTDAQRADDQAFVRGLYRDLLHREPDPEGFAAHLAGLERGATRADIRQVFLGSSEYAELQRPRPTPPIAPTPAPAPAPAPRTYPEPGRALSTVPPKESYLDVPVDQTSPDAAVLSTARWIRSNRPGYFDKGDDRKVAFDMMTEIIGVLRAHGYDAHRVVNHTDRPVGDGLRYGSDAVVLNGKIFDLYGAWGDPSRGTPQLLYVGDYASDRLRE